MPPRYPVPMHLRLCASVPDRIRAPEHPSIKVFLLLRLKSSATEHETHTSQSGSTIRSFRNRRPRSRVSHSCHATHMSSPHLSRCYQGQYFSHFSHFPLWSQSSFCQYNLQVSTPFAPHIPSHHHRSVRVCSCSHSYSLPIRAHRPIRVHIAKLLYVHPAPLVPSHTSRPLCLYRASCPCVIAIFGIHKSGFEGFNCTALCLCTT